VTAIQARKAAFCRRQYDIRWADFASARTTPPTAAAAQNAPTSDREQEVGTHTHTRARERTTGGV